MLLAGADALCAADWPERPDRSQRGVCTAALRELLAGLPADADRVNAAIVDIPYAVVRRHLLAGRVIPASADDIVADCARALIAGRLTIWWCPTASRRLSAAGFGWRR